MIALLPVVPPTELFSCMFEVEIKHLNAINHLNKSIQSDVVKNMPLECYMFIVLSSQGKLDVDLMYRVVQPGILVEKLMLLALNHDDPQKLGAQIVCEKLSSGCFTKSAVSLSISTNINESNTKWVRDGKITFKLTSSVPNQACVISLTEPLIRTPLNQMLYDQITSDMTIMVVSARIPAHKVFLVMVSPVFKAMFTSQMSESTSNELVISDFSEEVVRSLLRCIYGSVGDTMAEVEKNPTELFRIAHKYEIDPLQRATHHHILRTPLNIDTAVATLLFADTFELGDVKAVAQKALLSHWFALEKKLGRGGLEMALGEELYAEQLQFAIEHCDVVVRK